MPCNEARFLISSFNAVQPLVPLAADKIKLLSITNNVLFSTKESETGGCKKMRILTLLHPVRGGFMMSVTNVIAAVCFLECASDFDGSSRK